MMSWELPFWSSNSCGYVISKSKCLRVSISCLTSQCRWVCTMTVPSLPVYHIYLWSSWSQTSRSLDSLLSIKICVRPPTGCRGAQNRFNFSTEMLFNIIKCWSCFIISKFLTLLVFPTLFCGCMTVAAVRLRPHAGNYVRSWVGGQVSGAKTISRFATPSASFLQNMWD